MSSLSYPGICESLWPRNQAIPYLHDVPEWIVRAQHVCVVVDLRDLVRLDWDSPWNLESCNNFYYPNLDFTICWPISLRHKGNVPSMRQLTLFCDDCDSWKSGRTIAYSKERSQRLVTLPSCISGRLVLRLRPSSRHLDSLQSSKKVST